MEVQKISMLTLQIRSLSILVFVNWRRKKIQSNYGNSLRFFIAALFKRDALRSYREFNKLMLKWLNDLKALLLPLVKFIVNCTRNYAITSTYCKPPASSTSAYCKPPTNLFLAVFIFRLALPYLLIKNSAKNN